MRLQALLVGALAALAAPAAALTTPQERGWLGPAAARLPPPRAAPEPEPAPPHLQGPALASSTPARRGAGAKRCIAAHATPPPPPRRPRAQCNTSKTSRPSWRPRARTGPRPPRPGSAPPRPSTARALATPAAGAARHGAAAPTRIDAHAAHARTHVAARISWGGAAWAGPGLGCGRDAWCDEGPRLHPSHAQPRQPQWPADRRCCVRQGSIIAGEPKPAGSRTAAPTAPAQGAHACCWRHGTCRRPTHPAACRDFAGNWYHLHCRGKSRGAPRRGAPPAAPTPPVRPRHRASSHLAACCLRIVAGTMASRPALLSTPCVCTAARPCPAPAGWGESGDGTRDGMLTNIHITLRNVDGPPPREACKFKNIREFDFKGSHLVSQRGRAAATTVLTPGQPAGGSCGSARTRRAKWATLPAVAAPLLPARACRWGLCPSGWTASPTWPSWT